jgi:hypothetical protein
MNATVMNLARYYAVKEVKAATVRGLKSAELSRLAVAYLDNHPEIIKRATKIVRDDPALRRMAERHGPLQ